jgi:putative flippase GtrA
MKLRGGVVRCRTAHAGRARWLGRWIMSIGRLAGGKEHNSAPSADFIHGVAVELIVRRLPRPFRFVIVGSTGLAVDIVLFTVLFSFGVHPLVAGLVALVVATFVTWRLNRRFTFDRSGRGQREEAMRYAAVTLAAQSTSYGVFALFVSTACADLPQVAIIIGAAAGAVVSYNGHRLFAFAPLTTRRNVALPSS